MFRILTTLVLLTSAAAHAQEKDHGYVYATFNATHVSTVPDAAGSMAITSTGVGLGISANIIHIPSRGIDIGLDFRFAWVPETGNNFVGATDDGRTNIFLGGSTMTFHPRHTRLRPYALISAGGLYATAYSASTASWSKSPQTVWSVFEFSGGVDCPITSHFGARIFDIGVGGGQKNRPTVSPLRPSLPSTPASSSASDFRILIRSRRALAYSADAAAL
jgi:hypothetical protein